MKKGLFRLLQVTCFFIVFAYLGVAGSFFGLIVLAMEFGLKGLILYIVPFIPYLAFSKEVNYFLFSWMSEAKEGSF